MDSSSDARDPVEMLAEEFMERQRRGERPTIEEYCERYPELADAIHDLFPALLMMENMGEVSSAPHATATTAAIPSSPRSRPPRSIGDYRILREVGRGGMGVVYEAEQVSLGRRVALKILPHQVASDEKALERFRREARAAARLHHTNIVPVFEVGQVGQAGETAYYAMQFIQGQGLDLVITELRRLRERSLDAHAPQSDAPADPRPTSTHPPADAAPGHEPNALRAVTRSLLNGHFGPGGSDDRWGDAAADHPTAEATLAHFSTADSQPNDDAAPPSSTSSPSVFPGGSVVSGTSTAGQRRHQFHCGVARIGLQAAHGLAYAHERGVIHRDIKPSNLLLDTARVRL